jgi:ribA/ribD-fused uncharacterized protein
MSIMTLEALRAQVRRGDTFEYLLFWGHTPPADGAIGPHCLSNWFPAPFEIDGVRYATTEHHMMAEKARCFGDEEHLQAILEAGTPAEAKALGRKVRGFVSEIWDARREQAVVEGNVAKFSQHEDMCLYLLGTGEKVLVEASPRDRIWGIGMGKNNPDAVHPERWRGQNLLGFVLMEVRRQLRGG